MFVVIAACVLSATGLSQVYRSRFWIENYDTLMAHGVAAMRGHGAIVGLIGAATVLIHNVWDGPVLVLTAFGWLLLAEGLFCVITPHISLRGMAAAGPDMRRKTVVGTGVGVLIVAGVLWAVLLGL